MQLHFGKFDRINRGSLQKGSALVAAVSLLVLLALVALGMLSLSAISLRSAGNASAMDEAKANARLALMIAIGELQKEVGPDMRITSTAALLDRNPETLEMDDVSQSNWLASYDSWGTVV